MDLDYDMRLYTTQILLVLASSKVPWTTFNLVGYSLGGGLSVAFTRYFPHMVDSLTLVAPGGIIRPYHVGWRSHMLYNWGILPEFIVRMLVKRRVRPRDNHAPGSAGAPTLAAAEAKKHVPNGDGDSNGGDAWDNAGISKYRPGVTVSSIIRWQVDHHEGFVTAFLSSIRNAPIYAPQEDWVALAMLLGRRRRHENNSIVGSTPGLRAGKIHIVLGEEDPVIVKDELIEDTRRVLGPDGVEIMVLPGGHEIPIAASFDVANAIEGFWHRY
ncbi:uncharacterized protein F4822DRAFT_420599 [Hypoxylon trugodes]|uniref:uncharacterized protein n=1 Tax=Hypoxylon trugodes TaxID=326681 RepID=UPI0021A24497|nr:uncharacterized protein F4822DRAFT_420599 [Hypoxylon trugodes]KAI1383428.1 hypothetical protein F4822DRAFT_420599 [Hypoxylon trugodes]